MLRSHFSEQLIYTDNYLWRCYAIRNGRGFNYIFERKTKEVNERYGEERFGICES